jgi:asparagine synthase (glutamine-hydrolysing)
MNALECIIYQSGTILSYNSILKSFLKMVNTNDSQDRTYFSLKQNIDINNLNHVQKMQLSYNLSKADIANYRHYNFIHAIRKLCINDLSMNANQPFVDPIQHKINMYPELKKRPTRELICNGNIYNYSNLLELNKFTDRDLQSTCDTEIILPLYIKYLESSEYQSISALNSLLADLNGDFTFVLSENIETYLLRSLNNFVIRDIMGVSPLYVVTSPNNEFIFFVSQLKGIPDYILKRPEYIISHVPIGSYWSFQTNFNNVLNMSQPIFTSYYSLTPFSDINNCTIKSTDPDTIATIYDDIKRIVTESVLLRFCSSQQPVGILLSGGFNSCLITEVICHYLNTADLSNKEITLFTVGDQLNSPIDLDVTIATSFIEHLSNLYKNIIIHHHKIYINEIEILTNDIVTTITQLESFDTRTVREAIPYYYLCQYISQNTNVKVLISGEGLNELLGDTSAFDDTSTFDDVEFQSKSVYLLQNMYKYNLGRATKIASYFNLDTRFPFLDKNVLEYFLQLHPKLKRAQYYIDSDAPIKKYIVRKAFEDRIPSSITWRRNSDIINSLTNFELRLTHFFNTMMSDVEYNTILNYLVKQNNIKHNLPSTKEEAFYRNTFETIYMNKSYLV